MHNWLVNKMCFLGVSVKCGLPHTLSLAECYKINTLNMLTKYIWEIAWRLDAKLLVDIHPAKYHFNITRRNTKIWC
jgi:hypothetical protein